VELPTALRSRLKLPPAWWSVLARIAWFSGWSPGAESFSRARRRGAEAAAALAAEAAVQGRILLAGHGWMNEFIGRALRRSGWQSPRRHTHQFWEYVIYRKGA